MRRSLTLLILFALTLTVFSWTYSLAAEATPILARLRAHIHQKKVTNYNVLTEGESSTVQSDASSSSSTGGGSTAAISSTSENTSSSASTSSGGASSSSGADSFGSSSGSNTANGSSSGGVGSSSGMGGFSSSTSSGSSTNDQSTAPAASSSGTDGPSSSAGATGASSSGVDSSSSTPSGIDSSSSTITSDSSSSGSIDSSSAGDASGSSSDSSASSGVDSSSGSNVSSGDGSSGSYSSSSSTGNSGPDCVIDQGVQLPDPKEVTFRMNRDLASLEDDFKARLRGDILTALGPSVCDKQVAISAVTAGSIVVQVKFLALNLRTDSPTPQQIATRFLAQVNNPKRDSILFTLPTASTTIPDSGSNVQPPSDDDDGSGLTAKVGGVRAWVILLILILIVIALALVFVWVRGLCKRKRSIGSRMSSPKKAESIQNELGHLSTPKSGPGRKYMRQI